MISCMYFLLSVTNHYIDTISIQFSLTFSLLANGLSNMESHHMHGTINFR
jgi:hypothetical protein